MSFASPGTVTGTGTANTVAKFTSATVVGNSLITDNGTTVAINTNSSFLSAAPSSGGAGFLTITGTLPSVTSATVLGCSISTTSAGSSANVQVGFQSILAAGYTGSASTYAGYSANTCAGTAFSIPSSAIPTGNIGHLGVATGNTTGGSMGLVGYAGNTIGYAFGVLGHVGNAGTNIGVAGFGGTSGTRIGVLAVIGTSSDFNSYTQAALLVDNTSFNVPIAIFRTAQVPVVTIARNGVTTFAAGLQYPIATKTTTYAILTTDSTILANAATAGFTITLPTAVGCAGQEFTIKKIDSTANNVTIVDAASANIDGAASLVIGTQWTSYTVQSNGTQWYIL